MSATSGSLLIEVCVDSVQSAINAVEAGADRLEVCGNLGIGGGTTPSLGLVKSIQRAVDVPLMVMVRPRIGDFLYSEEEVDVMLEDIRIFKQRNVRGFVVGALSKDGRVNAEVMKRLVDEILPFEGTAHTSPEKLHIDQFDSGQGKAAHLALPMLEELFEEAKSLVEDEVWGLTLMPGSGINTKSVATVLESLLPRGLCEIHLSGGKWVEGEMEFKRAGMGMGSGGEGNWGIWVTQEDEIRGVREVVDEAR
ncbi:uncharacterized protein LACBIDRAFT_320880 [Laccaria bicolor S238N-H82]|uniref:Copper homeostasis protein cutC homolog n=1 Tax=Laccaria bicolor (strain S238N-H82 / ATCC MYA-4686) TaxID=486041 RepID=B0CRL1_LACBS|nr:uncharacterized protein LACBIDRAFT_320880 [Laccaria bicolor S238N-H82]EDR15222.1 predicted protein [Laccaria bicolor S238N-H82]|eukprot:XP_001873430.1 predicted protein [Laccaria bicolor S238N-H82]